MKFLQILLLATLPISAYSAQDIKVSDIDYGTQVQQDKAECKVVRMAISSGESQEVEERELCLKNGKYEVVEKKNLPEPNKIQP